MHKFGTCVWRTDAQWRLPGKKRVSTHFFGFVESRHTARILARQVRQERTQVVCSNKVGRNRLAESNGTPAMDPGSKNRI